MNVQPPKYVAIFNEEKWNLRKAFELYTLKKILREVLSMETSVGGSNFYL